MNKFVVSSFCFLAASLFVVQAQASGKAPQPSACPAPSAIQARGLDVVGQLDSGLWVTGVLADNYGTSDSWTFLVGNIQADDNTDAITKATASLSGITQNGDPVYNAKNNKWVCIYNNEAGYLTGAITPPMNQLHSAFGSLR